MHGSISSAATAARCWSTRRRSEVPVRGRGQHRHGSCYVYGTYYGISPYRDDPRAAARCFFNELVHPQRHQPERPGRVLHPVGDEQGQPEPAVPRDVSPVPHGQCQGRLPRPTSRGSRSAPDLTSGCPGRGAERRPGLLHLRHRHRRRHGRSIRVPKRATSTSARTRRRATTRPGPGRQGEAARPPGREYRRRPEQLPDRVRRVRGLQRGDAGQPGHVFKTTDGGNKWTNISGNLPRQSRVNSLVLDPSYPNTLYAGTDVGAFVTYNGGETWSQLGTGFPTVSIWQLDFDPSQAGSADARAPVRTAGRHATLNDARSVPAFVPVEGRRREARSGRPAPVTYTLTLKNIGNASCDGSHASPTRCRRTRRRLSAQDGGTVANGKVTWSGLTVPAARKRRRCTSQVSVAAALEQEDQVDRQRRRRRHLRRRASGRRGRRS